MPRNVAVRQVQRDQQPRATREHEVDEQGGKPAELVVRLKAAAAAPILYNPEIKLPAGATEVLPSQLPPLRGDSATLVVGKLARDVKALDFTLSGEVAGKDFSVKTSHVVPAGDKLRLLHLMRTFAGGGVSVSCRQSAPDHRRVLLGQYRTLGARSKVLPMGRAQRSVGRVRTFVRRADAAKRGYWPHRRAWFRTRKTSGLPAFPSSTTGDARDARARHTE